MVYGKIDAALRALKEAAPAIGAVAETEHQRLMREDPQYVLDIELHGPLCALRCEHADECSNEEWCVHNNYRYHECGSPEHWS